MTLGSRDPCHMKKRDGRGGGQRTEELGILVSGFRLEHLKILATINVPAIQANDCQICKNATIL